LTISNPKFDWKFVSNGKFTHQKTEGIVFDYSTANHMLLTPPKSELHSSKEKWGSQFSKKEWTRNDWPY
jgi:hypothetical protein